MFIKTINDIKNRIEIDLKSVYLNLDSDKVSDLPGSHTFSGANYLGALGTTTKLTKEAIARL